MKFLFLILLTISLWSGSIKKCNLYVIDSKHIILDKKRLIFQRITEDGVIIYQDIENGNLVQFRGDIAIYKNKRCRVIIK